MHWDGILINRIKVVHSDETIVDWNNAKVWLDGSLSENYNNIGLAHHMVEKKLEQINDHWVAQIHHAALEIGKADGRKYGADGDNAWCSEFASWALRKGFWNTPTGDIGSKAMADWFDDRGRLKTKNQVISKSYRMIPGDYVRFQWSSGDHHSAIFMEYLDPWTDEFDDETRFQTIEGNTAKTVAVRTRRLGDIRHVGSTK